MPVNFPPIESATEEGLVAVGGKLDTETLYAAYTKGIFPWPISSETPMTWFSPDPRGVLFIDDFHVSKSFLKFLSKSSLQIKINHNFQSVIEYCSKVERAHEEGTWIGDDVIEGFTQFFNQGYAYSIEVTSNDKLIGGLYGVCIGKFVSGESMFHIESNASKVALTSLYYFLKKHSIPFIDTQMVTPIIGHFGAKNISREKFLTYLPQLINQNISRKDIFDQEEITTNSLYQFLKS